MAAAHGQKWTGGMPLALREGLSKVLLQIPSLSVQPFFIQLVIPSVCPKFSSMLFSFPVAEGLESTYLCSGYLISISIYQWRWKMSQIGRPGYYIIKDYKAKIMVSQTWISFTVSWPLNSR